MGCFLGWRRIFQNQKRRKYVRSCYLCIIPNRINSRKNEFFKNSTNKTQNSILDLSSFWAYLVLEKKWQHKNVRTQLLVRNDRLKFSWLALSFLVEFYLPYVQTEFHFTELLWCLPLWYSSISQHSLDFNKISKNLIFEFLFSQWESRVQYFVAKK